VVTEIPDVTTEPGIAGGRPSVRLPNRELVRISLYWLGLSSIFAGLSFIMAGRLEFTGLADKADAGRALFLGVGALLLWPVDERRRDDDPSHPVPDRRPRPLEAAEAAISLEPAV
jgi:hypothetical protein